MQKAVRLNILARNTAAKQTQKARQRADKQAWKEWHQATNRNKAIQGDWQTEERSTRRKDWIAGPLAPNRNAGTQRGSYGTIDSGFTQLPTIPKSVRAGPKGEGYAVRDEDDTKGFKGRTIVGNVVEGDRVVIIAGPERIRGLIGYVNHVDLEREEVKLRNVNTVDINYPSYAQPPANADNPDPVKYFSTDLPIPMSHIRLVVATNELGDVIIRHVHAGPPYVQQEIGSNLPSHTRYMTGVTIDVDEQGNKVEGEALTDPSLQIKKKEIEIPWPTQNFPFKFEHFEGDTQRTAVSRPTWSVSLLNSPLGYKSDVPENVEISDSPYSRAPHLLTVDVQGTSGLANAQRSGLDGFIDYSKMVARREKIAAGIMNELRNKHKNLKLRHDDVAFVKRSMIEDARAIWYQERKLSTPQSQAAELAVQQKTKQREEKLQEEKAEREAEIRQFASEVRELEVEGKGLAARVMHKNVKVESLVGFRPDKKMAKRVVALTAQLEGLQTARKGKGKSKKKEIGQRLKM